MTMRPRTWRRAAPLAGALALAACVVAASEQNVQPVPQVSDAGSGIPPEDLEHLFQRFTRTSKARHSNVRGLGVGLYIAKELVVAHEGRIWVDSTPGQTTTFHVALPSRVAEQKVA